MKQINTLLHKKFTAPFWVFPTCTATGVTLLILLIFKYVEVAPLPTIGVIFLWIFSFLVSILGWTSHFQESET